MNKAYDRSVKVLSVLIVPAVVAVACFAWAAARPPEVPLSAVSFDVPDPPAPVREPVTTVESATLVFEAAPVVVKADPKPAKASSRAKRPRTCGWYPMYASGDERVWICS